MNIVRLLTMSVVAVLIWSEAASAQVVGLQRDTTETNRPAIIPFLEGTDVFWSLQRGEGPEAKFPNVLEADIMPHLVAFQNFTDIVDIDEQASRGAQRIKEFSVSISGTPAVRIRMLRETSNPVRTPSYMPRGNVQIIWARNLRESIAAAAARLPATSRQNPQTEIAAALAALPTVSLWEAHFIIGHHSNGQDGCLSKEQERLPPETGDCFPPAVVTAETINRIDGSFSTNFFRTGINYSRNWMTGTEEMQAVREARLRVEIEHHPRAWMDEDMVELYGRTRLNLGGAYAAKDLRGCQRRLEVSGAAVWNPGVVETVTEWSGNVQFSCFPWDNGGWGFFVRLYSGQDYYNVGFLDEITRLQFGVTFNQTGFFRFRTRPPSR
jgi:hypothetical protein